ncbi:MAG TPA: general secretion pathway protein GspK [Verrucomicrobiae bacterium]|nr:general secretion pathway protein GspK [Verrucomicrobiae bacterium]
MKAPGTTFIHTRLQRGVLRPPEPGNRFNASSQSGIALIIVMISIFVLTMLAGGFALSMKVETRLARNANSETELEWLGRSAVECARWELAQQYMIAQEPYDGLDQVWAGGPGGIGTSNSPLAGFRHEIDTKDGLATWTIVDLESKANINVATEPILQQALMLMGADAGEVTPVVNSIQDWIDPNTASHRVQGAKDDYYQSLDPPYHCKNGPIDDMSELLLIKGVTPELYYGLAATNYQPNRFMPQASRAPIVNPVPIGFTNLFTPLSLGKINLNTASAEVLQLIPGVPREAAEGIVGARSGEDDGSGLMGPYRSVAQVQRVPQVTPIMSQQIQQFCDVRSYTFEVHVDAQVAGYHRHFIGVVGRPPGNPRGIKVLNFYWTD